MIEYLKRAYRIQVYGLKESLLDEFHKQSSCRYVPTHKELISNRYPYLFDFNYRTNEGNIITLQITSFIVITEEETDDFDMTTELFYALSK